MVLEPKYQRVLSQVPNCWRHTACSFFHPISDHASLIYFTYKKDIQLPHHQATNTLYLLQLTTAIYQLERAMGAAGRSWMVAASIGAVEALKDQGICRWNYPLRLLQQHAKNNICQVKKFSAQSASAISSRMENHEKLKQSEESLRKVMYLSCWGPN